MKVHKGASNYNNTQGSVVTIGTFDGVHIGHRAILQRLIDSAQKQQLASVLLTFFPHPRMVLQVQTNIQLINTLEEKKQLLAQTGLEHLIIHPFTIEFSRLTALTYVRDILVNQLKAKKIIIGYDHRFGRNRTATIQDLKEYGKTYGFSVEEISAQELDDVAVSSTKIRKALEQGAVETANEFLASTYSITGTIVKGKALGRTIGYPTANLKIDETYKLIPKKGVYIVCATIDDKLYYGITNIGTNPTVGGTQTTIETYFLDCNTNLYERDVTLQFLKYIREEALFDGVTSLQKAIQQDESYARHYLESLR